MTYKRILTIQDISCVGQCSLTVALPILSACGVETAIICSSETQIVRVDSILPKIGRDGTTTVLFSENEITYRAEWAPHSVKVGDEIEVYSIVSFFYKNRICTNIPFYVVAWYIICGLGSLYGVFVFLSILFVA